MDKKDFEPVRVNHHYRVPPNIIFEAWVKPQMISKWLFIGPSSELTSIEIDPVAGGRFSILELERTTGEYIDHYGEYCEVIPSGRLVFTLSVPTHFPGVTRVRIYIEPVAGGCELTLTQTGVSPDTTEGNWRDMLQQLESVENQISPRQVQLP